MRGFLPPTLLPFELGNTVVEVVQQHLFQQDVILCELKDNLYRSQNRMKQMAHNHQSELQFEVRDPVLVKLQLYR